jgi:ribonuclease III
LNVPDESTADEITAGGDRTVRKSGAKAAGLGNPPQRSPRSKSLASLERRLGYKFSDLCLLQEALTHSSARAGAGSGDNERLEFLGDRVLGLVIAELLIEAHTEAREGDLARLFNKLVRRETCASVAAALGLGEHLHLSEGEDGSGGRAKVSILADACEAVLGAIYRDGGLEAARKLVREAWAGQTGLEMEARRDAKTALQEWSQARRLGLPAYVHLARTGPEHAPRFACEVRVEGLAPAHGEGASKRAAEQAAAQAMLERQGLGGP